MSEYQEKCHRVEVFYKGYLLHIIDEIQKDQITCASEQTCRCKFWHPTGKLLDTYINKNKNGSDSVQKLLTIALNCSSNQATHLCLDLLNVPEDGLSLKERIALYKLSQGIEEE